MAVYVDETVACGNKQLQKRTDRIPDKFKSKPREFAPLLLAEENIYKKHQYFLH